MQRWISWLFCSPFNTGAYSAVHLSFKYYWRCPFWLCRCHRHFDIIDGIWSIWVFLNSRACDPVCKRAEMMGLKSFQISSMRICAMSTRKEACPIYVEIPHAFSKYLDGSRPAACLCWCGLAHLYQHNCQPDSNHKCLSISSCGNSFCI